MDTTIFPTSPDIDDMEASRISYLSSTITSLIACITAMLALMYLIALAWAYRYSQLNPRPISKGSGIRVQRYAPWVYVFLVLSSLAEVSTASWILLQYSFHQNYPNRHTLIGTRFLLFSASWTTVTAGAYTLLFLHPAWSRYTVSSVGAQVIWVSLTLLLWIVGAGIVNGAIPSLLVHRRCFDIVYCPQLAALFGVAVVESVTLAAGLVITLWIAWQSTRDILKPSSVSLQTVA